MHGDSIICTVIVAYSVSKPVRLFLMITPSGVTYQYDMVLVPLLQHAFTPG